jgi:hypothetical protein
MLLAMLEVEHDETGGRGGRFTGDAACGFHG